MLLEHIDHLYDLIEDNYWEDYLYDNIRSMEVILEAQLDEINKRNSEDKYIRHTS